MKTTKLMIMALGSLALCGASAADEPVTPSPYEVIWDSPSPNCNGTMPLGNGEIALNAWIESSGDLRFYIARTDSWDDSGRLVKVGALRIKVGDGPAERTKKFRQILTAKDGTLSASYGEGDARVDLRLWVDANRPVICVEAQTAKPTTASATMELWRNVATELPEKQCSDVLNCALFPEKTVVEPDTVLSGLKDRIGWYHRNIKSVGPANLAKMQGVDDFPRADPLLHRTFGAVVATGRPQRVDDRTLQSTAGTSHLFEIAVLAKHPATVDQWLGEIQTILDAARKADLTTRRAAHEKWWAGFWNRSWIHISQNDAKGDDTFVLSRAYALQRYMSACVGRGKYPIKYPGMKVVVDEQGVQTKGYRFESRCTKPTPWQAEWIWVVGDAPDASWFRKEITLADTPQRIAAWMTADIKYELYVNGRLVSRGPVDMGRDYAGGDTHRWFYDYRDLTPFFMKGKNVIAAKVFRQWPIGFRVSRGQPGFLFEADVTVPGQETLTVKSDGTWRGVPADDAYGWQAPEFNDASHPISA